MKANKMFGWSLGLIIVIACAMCIFICPTSSILGHVPSFVCRGFICLAISSALCLARLLCGPSAADRAAAVDVLGILIVGICAVLAIPAGCDWYIDIAIAWALQSFVGAMVFAKYIEGKDLDE